VHFDLGSSSAAAGGPPEPSGQYLGGEDPFTAPTTAQPSNQVSISYLKFTIFILTNLIQRGLSSPPYETFELDNGSDDAQEGGASPSSPNSNPGPSTPTRPSKKAQKAGSRLASSGDDTLRFFQVVEGKKQCKFCL
jgi:hypothetical protein